MAKSGGMYAKSGRALNKMIKEGGQQFGGNLTQGGPRFGPKTSNSGSPFGGGYGGGSGSTSPGILGPKQRVNPLRKKGDF